MNPRVRDKLCQILATYGKSLYLDPRRCENLLRDLCPQNKREVHVLVGALREHVPAELAAPAMRKSAAASIGRFSRRLEDNLALAAEPARWAVETWALALGVVTAQQLAAAQPKPKPAQQPPPKPAQRPIPQAPAVQSPAGQPRVVPPPVAPPVMMLQRPTQARRRAIMLTICLVLAGSGAGVAAIWNRPAFSQPRHDSLQIRSTHADFQVRLPVQVAVSAVPPESQQPPVQTSEPAGALTGALTGAAVAKSAGARAASGASPPITEEEVAIARGALLPQPPWIAAESAPP
jgi:hypothetical protein